MPPVPFEDLEAPAVLADADKTADVAAADIVAVTAARDVAHPAVPAPVIQADAVAVTAAAGVTTTSAVLATAQTHSTWPTLPEALHDVPLTLDEENGTYITCVACQQYPQNKGPGEGKIRCARRRFFKYHSLLEHIKTEYHTVAYKQLLYHKDGKNLEESEFLEKHNHKYTGNKRFTDVRTFFQPQPKKKKIAPSRTTIPSSHRRESEGMAREVIVFRNSLAPPPLPNDNTFLGTIWNCNGALGDKDVTDKGIQTGLKATSKFYLYDDGTRTIKSVPNKPFLNVFSSHCTMNTAIR